jgi:hypothetical protein
MAVRPELANLARRSIDEMIRFLQSAFREFTVRGEDEDREGSRWVHAGNLGDLRSEREGQAPVVGFLLLPLIHLSMHETLAPN